MIAMSFRPYDKGTNNKWQVWSRYKGHRLVKAVPTKQDGREWVKLRMAEIDKEEVQAARGDVLRYGTAVEEYCEDCAARMQPNTVSGKFRYANAFSVWLGCNPALATITRKQCRQFHRHIAAESTNENANEHLKNLKAMWNWHIREENLRPGANPWAYVDAMPEEEKIKRVPTREQVAAILMAATPDELDYLTILVQSAARPGEILRLSWDETNMDRGVMMVWTRKRKGGAKQYRPLPITDTIRGILERRWNGGSPAGPFVFTNPRTGKRYTRNHWFIKKMMGRVCERADVPPYTLGAFRHYVSQRLEDGQKASLVDIQRLLGHKRATTTDNYLRALAPDVSKVGGMLEDEHQKTVDLRGNVKLAVNLAKSKGSR